MKKLLKNVVFLLMIFCSACQVVVCDPIRSIQECDIFFSSQKNLANELIALIDRENESLKIAVYCLMNQQIANAMIRAHKRGAKVEVIVDPFSTRKGSSLKKIAEAGIPLLIWSPKSAEKEKTPLMHDKFCVFGNKKVWTGSFNFTVRATTNQENAIVLEDTEVAKRYLKEFERLKSKGVLSYEAYMKLNQKPSEN